MVDYSKWNNFKFEENDEDDSGPQIPFINLMMGSQSNTDNMFPKYFFSDPKAFRPVKSKETGRYENWGLPEEDAEAIMKRKMVAQMSNSYPPRTFVNKLIELKKEKLAASRDTVEPLFKRDFIIKVSFEKCTPEIWRRIRVCGGIPLNVLHDKVLCSAIGWARNYHGYKFTDYSDGACIGPTTSSSVDLIHIDKDGYAFLDSKLVKLAEVLRKEGDTMGYLYDLGDQWHHTITLETIVPESETTGQCELIAGARSCVPEDLGEDYNVVCEILKNKNHKRYQEVYTICWQGMNIHELQGHKFDPEYFNLNQMRNRLKEAFRSTAAADYGQKEFRFDIRGHSCGDEIYEKTKEVDDKRDAMCFACGNVNNLLKCARCKKAFYCSLDCQRNDWKIHKKSCKEATSKP